MLIYLALRQFEVLGLNLKARLFTLSHTSSPAHQAAQCGHTDSDYGYH